MNAVVVESNSEVRVVARASGDPAVTALLARLLRYFEQAVRTLPKQDRARVLSAPDDFWTLMETLAVLPVEESPELKVRLRGALARHELLSLDGGVIPPAKVAELLHISRQAVGQRRAGGKLFGVEGPRGYLYPLWQFDNAGLLDGLEAVLVQLSDEDNWTKLIFFVRPNDACGGKRPLDLLRGRQFEAVERAAALYGVQAPT